MSCCIRKPTICMCKTKGSDQLCSNCTADQRLCFSYIDSTIPFLLLSKISSLLSCLYMLLCVGPGRKLRLLLFSCECSIIMLQQLLDHVFYCFHHSLRIRTKKRTKKKTKEGDRQRRTRKQRGRSWGAGGSYLSNRGTSTRKVMA